MLVLRKGVQIFYYTWAWIGASGNQKVPKTKRACAFDQLSIDGRAFVHDINFEKYLT